MGVETPSVILVTGASRGIGLELVRQYAAQGSWRVHACCRQPERAGDLRRAAAEADGRVVVHALDVTDTARIRALAGELSGEPIDILLNNAGVYGGREDGFGHVDEKVWLDTLRVNTIAPLKMAEAFTPHITNGRRKVIASISSQMGSIDDNGSGGYYAYRSSKTALNMVMKSLSLDLRGSGIICLALNPGWVRTDMGGAAAPLSPEQSVRGLRKILDAATLADTGKFLGHDGSQVPW